MTWPSDWSERLRGKDCAMCAQDRPDEDEYGIRIYAGRYSDAYLQRVSWQLGYTIVMWRGRHIAEPTELDAQEASGYWLEVLQVASALQRHYRPVTGTSSHDRQQGTAGQATDCATTRLLSRRRARVRVPHPCRHDPGGYSVVGFR